MGSLQSWRKAYGALKDTTKVGLAKVNSGFKDVDIAIVKATNHVECPPKERHLRKILAATSALRPRADVAYCIHALSRRLAKTHNWTVALKTLIVIHRTLREGDPTFREEFLNFSIRGHVLQMSNFKDDSSPIAWDCSAWVRTYALFLEERLECFRILRYDVEAERMSRSDDGQEKGHSRTRHLECGELLEQLPALQRLLYRLIGCRPEEVAAGNYVIQYALALVLKESFKIYCAVNDGIINLVDKFFEMPRHEAIKALDIYRRAGQQAVSLQEFYELCKGLELARNFQFPTLKEPPQSFLSTMEEYVREAPRMVSISTTQLEYPERLLLTYKREESSIERENVNPLPVEKPKSEPVEEVAPPLPNPDGVDLLGLNETKIDASIIEESNALALAIVPTTASGDSLSAPKSFDPTGWELALVTTPSTSTSTMVESKLGGGLDKLTLDSLYDEAAYRQQGPVYGSTGQNPFEVHDPFAASNTIAPPPAVQLAAMMQPQQMPMMVPPSNPFFQPSYPLQQQHIMMNSSNPFADTGFGSLPPHAHHQNYGIGGGSNLL